MIACLFGKMVRCNLEFIRGGGAAELQYSFIYRPTIALPAPGIIWENIAGHGQKGCSAPIEAHTKTEVTPR